MTKNPERRWKQHAKDLYERLPLISLLKLVRAVGTPRHYKYLTTSGRFTTQLENGESLELIIRHDLYIEKEIFWNGIRCEFEPMTLRTWCELSADATTILDIGANTGIFSLLASKYARAAAVHAFEPVPYNADVLEANIALNGSAGIHLRRLALSDTDGEQTMFVMEDQINYLNSLEGNRYESGATEVRVETAKLATYIEDAGIVDIDLIKLDVEGHEVSVLAGMEDYLSRFKPTLIIEVLDDEMGAQLQSLLEPIGGYRFFLIDDISMRIEEMAEIRTPHRTNFLIRVD